MPSRPTGEDARALRQHAAERGEEERRGDAHHGGHELHQRRRVHA
jgi:hypothetical protein